jgi:hypothetical protein
MLDALGIHTDFALRAAHLFCALPVLGALRSGSTAIFAGVTRRW